MKQTETTTGQGEIWNCEMMHRPATYQVNRLSGSSGSYVTAGNTGSDGGGAAALNDAGTATFGIL